MLQIIPASTPNVLVVICPGQFALVHQLWVIQSSASTDSLFMDKATKLWAKTWARDLAVEELEAKSGAMFMG